MSMLRLGTHELPAAEVVLVQTLFRLFAYRENFHWCLASAPPYDALLMNGASDAVTNNPPPLFIT
ncbi:hypothetical protein [Ottowia sp.]|uniref:hypothetical protein n=1 Tax=Ottowia sp. TaxID=1898956 RepID=UPI0039E4FCF9